MLENDWEVFSKKEINFINKHFYNTKKLIKGEFGTINPKYRHHKYCIYSNIDNIVKIIKFYHFFFNNIHSYFQMCEVTIFIFNGLFKF